MAINILEDDNKKKYILIALGFLIVCLIVFIIWRFVLPKNDNSQTEPPSDYLGIDINFASLSNFRIKEMNIFRSIEPFSGDSGRSNPFAPTTP